jgi:hypothetical protein
MEQTQPIVPLGGDCLFPICTSVCLSRGRLSPTCWLSFRLSCVFLYSTPPPILDNPIFTCLGTTHPTNIPYHPPDLSFPLSLPPFTIDHPRTNLVPNGIQLARSRSIHTATVELLLQDCRVPCLSTKTAHSSYHTPPNYHLTIPSPKALFLYMD